MFEEPLNMWTRVKIEVDRKLFLAKVIRESLFVGVTLEQRPE